MRVQGRTYGRQDGSVVRPNSGSLVQEVAMPTDLGVGLALEHFEARRHVKRDEYRPDGLTMTFLLILEA